MVAIVVAAGAFAILSMLLDPPPRYDPWERDERWALQPLKEDFWPKQGERVRAKNSILVKLAYTINGVDGQTHGRSWRVTPDGLVHYESHTGHGTGSSSNPAPAAGLAMLPGFLAKLPPPDRAARLDRRVVVAFPVDGQYEVRSYSGPVPNEVDEIAKALNATGW